MQQTLEALDICSDHHHGGRKAHLMEYKLDALHAHTAFMEHHPEFCVALSLAIV